MKQSLEKNVIAGLVVVFLVLIANAALSNQAANTLVRNEELVSHTREVQTQIGAVLSTVRQAESSVRGYVVTGDDSFLQPYQQATAELGPALKRLSDLTTDNPIQKPRLEALNESARRRMA